jgi:hypothetical protein
MLGVQLHVPSGVTQFANIWLGICQIGFAVRGILHRDWVAVSIDAEQPHLKF